MTTREQKEQAAVDYGERFHESYDRMKGFEAGAEWAESQMRWIPVEEQMPDELIAVQVFIPDQDHLICTAIYEEREGWYEVYEGVTISDPVAHWMPLPEPPAKEDGKNDGKTI